MRYLFCIYTVISDITTLKSSRQANYSILLLRNLEDHSDCI